MNYKIKFMLLDTFEELPTKLRLIVNDTIHVQYDWLEGNKGFDFCFFTEPDIDILDLCKEISEKLYPDRFIDSISIIDAKNSKFGYGIVVRVMFLKLF